MGIFRKRNANPPVNISAKTNDVPVFVIDVQMLHMALEKEMVDAAKLRQVYELKCRELARGDCADVLGTKQQLDLTLSRIEGINAEIAEKKRLLDQAEGREAEESRRRQLREDFELARERLAESQAELAKLRAEYIALPEKIRVAEWRFNEALRAFNRVGEKLR